MPQAGGYFGFDEDPFSHPGGMTAAAAFQRYADGRGGPTMGPTPGSDRFAGGSFNQMFRNIFGRGGNGRITSQALPPLDGYQQTPYSPPAAPPPSYKPSTKITSGDKIMALINSMIGGPSESPQPDFGTPFTMDAFNQMVPAPEPQGPVQVPISLPPVRAVPRSASMFDPSSWFRRAHGGGIPAYARGGYPDLYDRPVRRPFATGGGDTYVEPDGQGDGRSDHVQALLSPGEFVMDAETVSLLGNGDNNAGARKLEVMRKKIRTQKGKALAKGKFSPDAKKDAAEYLVGDPMGDGLRRRGREK